MARRSRKITPEFPAAISNGFTCKEERESGEGCSRESINNEQSPLAAREDGGTALPRPPGAAIAEPQPCTESRVGRRFVRCRNSWIEEEKITLNLGSLRESHTASLIEEADESGDDDDGGPIDHDANEDTDRSKALLAYFMWLSRTHTEDVNFQLMEQFLSEGADINAATEKGATVFHDVASNWDVAVADFLLERGADIHASNKLGQTPLHLAASTDHTEMVRWLLDKGAHLDATTVTELQTPIHYAARNDSLEALQVLFEKGGNYEISDYKGRTPLYLAAELDRTVAAEYLLSLDPPADCQAIDKRGNHVIGSMIRTMPDVAQLALDQLHRIAPVERKQYFLLNHLEPESRAARHGIKTPFEMAVELRQHGVLSHPVMQELIQQKWTKCVRWSFYALFAMYISSVLSWSLLIAYPSVQEKHIYIFPRDLWRVILAVVAVGTLFYQVADESLEVIKSRRKHKAYTRARSIDLEDDLKNVDPNLPEEKRYLESELASSKRSPSNYFKDPWNIIDIVCYIILFVLILLHSLDVAFHTETLALWTARLACPGVILIWVRLLKYARAFHAIGPLIAIIGHLIGDILRYFALYTTFLVPYVICFWIMFGGDRAEGQPENEDLTKVYRTTIMVFRMSLIDDYPYSTLRDIDELMSFILVVTFLLIAGVVGLNLFIALLSDTFQRVYDNAQANALLQQAQLILVYEEKVCPCIYERYLRHIHDHCNPSSTYYDDDDQKREQPPELQKITHQIHNIVSEIRTDGEEENKKLSSEVNILAAKIAQQEETISLMSQTLSEIKTLLHTSQTAPVTNDIRAPPSLLEHNTVITDLTTATRAEMNVGGTQTPPVIEPPQTRKLPPLNATVSVPRVAGVRKVSNERIKYTDENLYQSQSTPSYLDCTSGSCPSLTAATSSHRRVKKVKKAQTKDYMWKHKR